MVLHTARHLQEYATSANITSVHWKPMLRTMTRDFLSEALDGSLFSRVLSTQCRVRLRYRRVTDAFNTLRAICEAR